MTLPTRPERQRARRAYLKKLGYRKAEIWIETELFERLQPYLEEYGRTHLGAAIHELLLDCVNSWDSDS